MTMLFLLGLPVVLLLYLLIVYRGVQEVRRRYPHWAPRRFVAVSFFAGPMLILAAGLTAAWILSGQPGGSDEQHRTGGSLAFLAINALTLMATIPASAIGYIIVRSILARED